MDLNLEDNVAIVTASSRGLGRASAAALVREGASVTICGRTPERLERTEAALAATGPGTIHAIRADITSPDDVARLINETVATFGGVDHLVTSAGVPPTGRVADLEPEQYRDAFDLLVMSVVYAIDETIEHLIASPAGSIVTITSRTVQEVVEGMALSNSVRRAVIGLMQTVAREYAPDVRANAVLPGAHETDHFTEIIERRVANGEYDDYEAGVAAATEAFPLGVGNPSDFGALVATLLSERAGFVTNASLPIDGGWHRS